MEAGEPFVKATYNLEGDCPLVFHVYKELAILESSTAMDYFSIVHVLLIQPSSAAAERVFSIRSNSFDDRQASTISELL